MPIEMIGEFGTPGASSDWVEAQGKLAIRRLKETCGEPPTEMDLEVVWQEHELGRYPVIGLVWEDSMRGVPGNYISRCEAALAAFENGGELPPGWTMPPVRSDDEELEEPFDPDQPPPDPPESFDLFETQRYISHLIQWSLEASIRERSRPYLVDNDDEGEAEV